MTQAGQHSYSYDANGNQTARIAWGYLQYDRGWDAENRLISAEGEGGSATYVYNGDNNRVKATVDGETTVYVGNLYEVNPSSGASGSALISTSGLASAPNL